MFNQLLRLRVRVTKVAAVVSNNSENGLAAGFHRAELPPHRFNSNGLPRVDSFRTVKSLREFRKRRPAWLFYRLDRSCGVPQVAFPVTFEQPGNGARIAAKKTGVTSELSESSFQR